VKRTAAFLGGAFLGVATLLLGLTWDLYLHAHDPGLAHREGPFALTNPGHLVLGAGVALLVAGLLGAAYTQRPRGRWSRRSFLAGALAGTAVSATAVAWSASAESGVPPPVAVVSAAHAHDTAPLARAVTAEELLAAARLLDETRAATTGYRDLRVAIAAGYRPMEPPDLPIAHYWNRAYFTEADILRPAHVQSLVYFNGPEGAVLIGAMYMMPRAGMDGPQVGGPLTVWHHHDNLCLDNRTDQVVAFAGSPFFDLGGKGGSCPHGSSHRLTPDMLHVWLVDNPGGPFDTDMEPDVVAAVLARQPEQ